MSTLFSYFKKANSTPGGSDSKKKGKELDNLGGRSLNSDDLTTSTPVSASRKKRRPSATLEDLQSPDARFRTPPRTTLNTSQSSINSSQTTPNSSHSESFITSGTFAHDELLWLEKDKLKDKCGRGTLHPDYNPRTLQVPKDYFDKLTPGIQQWWAIKADNFDAVIMFKVGKFYELYHMDAVIGVRELSLTFMKADFAHCGFPETAFGRYSGVLVQRGYKVVRVEQVETPSMMEDRIKRKGVSCRSDRAVRREVCSVITRGTRTLTSFDGAGAAEHGESLFLLAVKESTVTGHQLEKTYGVCLIDTCEGTFHLGQFADDDQSSRLRTLMAHFPPGHLLYERRGVGVVTMGIINQLISTNIKEALIPEVEFWSCEKTLQTLAEGKYFRSRSGDGNDESEQLCWPDSLMPFLDGNLSANSCYELAVSALGACIWCLCRAHKAYAILSLRRFELYDPLNSKATQGNEQHGYSRSSSRTMILDDVTLSNLDILAVSGGQAGTLLKQLDHTVTPFGKRLLRRWLCAPLVQVPDIVARQDAVQELMQHTAAVEQARAILSKCLDLERLLRKIHCIGCQNLDKTCPDSRAIFFEHVLYSKRKIADFISVLDGLHLSLEVLRVFDSIGHNMTSKMLHELLTMQASHSSHGEHHRPQQRGLFPDIREHLQFYDKSFDRAQAKEKGVIVPCPGVNLAYDKATEEISAVEDELQMYLKEQRRKLRSSNIAYWGTGRNRYQLEVPESVLVNVKLDDKYELKSQKKGFRRYRTAKIEQMLDRLTAAEERRDTALRDTMGRLFRSFDEHFQLWEDVVLCLSELDVLMSIAIYSTCASDTMCRPRLVNCTSSSDAENQPYLSIEDGRHPCVTCTHTGGDFIPNSMCIRGPRNCLLVTGPNMGGKSTLLRQCGLLVVLAQLGSFVPAEKMELSPVDRVFTRMGASDRIMARESTFYVELKETAAILQHATCHSLVLVDELGRGTATYDGAAIASAVVKQLAEVIRCRSLFSTHYHFIMDQFTESPYVNLGHMACLVEPSDEDEVITFLYKLTEGVCPKSYGFNVAGLAGLPREVVTAARDKAGAYEKDAHQIRILRRLLSRKDQDTHHLKELLDL